MKLVTLLEKVSAPPQSTNSFGNPIAHSEEGLRNFWNWFGRSKVVDKEKRPLVVFHGTTSDFRAFDPDLSNSNTGTGVPHGAFVFTNSIEMASSYAGQKTKEWGFPSAAQREQYKIILLKNKDSKRANEFFHQHAVQNVQTYKTGGNLVPVYLKMLKPLIVNARGENWRDIPYGNDYVQTNDLMDEAKTKGYDGLIVRNVRDYHHQYGAGKPGNVFAVFSPNQIKSAIGNQGSFFPVSNHIDESVILKEAFPFDPGTGPTNIIDLRAPGPNKGKWRSYKASEIHGIKSPGKYYDKPKRTYACLTKNGAILFYYGTEGNIINWKEILEKCRAEMDADIQDNVTSIVAVKTGWLISRSRETGGWSGDRNQYSADVKTIAQRLLDLGLAKPTTPIWIGNTASTKGEIIGSIGKIIAKGDPARLVLYHGTSSARAHHIMKEGLKALPMDDRVWNGRKDLTRANRPEHRDDSVYLTASRPQAEYYAKKATNVDRKRYGPSQRSSAYTWINQARHNLDRYTRMLNNPEIRGGYYEKDSPYYRRENDLSGMPDSWFKEKVAEYTKRVASLERTVAYSGTIVPLLMQITLTKSEFNKLMADDDFLIQNKGHDPADWQKSLSDFGQIAFRGTIPPNRIKIIAQGKDAKQNSD
jgi:hypothetical protein